MNKIKLRFFIASLGGGGAEKVLVDLLNKLDKTIYDITLNSVVGGIYEDKLPTNIRYNKILNVGIKSIIFKLFVHLPKVIVAKRYFKEEQDIDIAYLEGYPTNIIAKVNNSKKKIAFIHMQIDKSDSFKNIYNKDDECRREYSLFDRVCFVSNDAKESFELVYGKLNSSTVIHNVIDYELVRRMSFEKTERFFQKNVFKIAAVGRLTAQKRMERILNIASKLRDKYKFEIVIAGVGEDYNKLIRQKEKLSLDNVKFVGFLENPYSLISQSDLLMCSSIYEGYSTVVCEAISLGVPVLTTDCSGMKEILKDGKYGHITENTEEKLQQGLEHILSDKGYYNKLKLRVKEYSKQISVENSIKDYDALFASLMKEI